MTVKEIVVEMDDRPGELSRIVAHLYENDVTMVAFRVGTENGKTVLRFLANDPDAAVSVLTGLAIQATTAEVIAARIPDHPGGLNSLLKALASGGINLIYVYTGVGTSSPMVILKADKPAEAIQVLKENWIQVLDEKVYHM